MSYGYFQGQEAEALAYYKKLLEVTTDATERRNLAELVAKLQKKANEGPLPNSSEIAENAVAN